MQQARIIEAGHRAEAESRGMSAERGDEKNQQMQEKVVGLFTAGLLLYC